LSKLQKRARTADFGWICLEHWPVDDRADLDFLVLGVVDLQVFRETIDFDSSG